MNREEATNSFNAAYDSIDRVFNELFFRYDNQTAQDVTHLLIRVLDLITQARSIMERVPDETWQETP